MHLMMPIRKSGILGQNIGDETLQEVRCTLGVLAGLGLLQEG